MNYCQLLSRLEQIPECEYEIEARLLIETFTNIKFSYATSHRSEELPLSDALEVALKRRESREPIQYILGKWDFYRQTYKVNENCLIPRSDTEILVERAIEMMPSGAHFLDLCTGSGCIAISVLAEREDTSAVMVDKYSDTLALAAENAVSNGVSDRARLIEADILEDSAELDSMTFDAILSNPPYIRPEVIEGLSEEVKHEPYAALWGGDDGLIFYNRILSHYSRCVRRGGYMLLEIGYDQGEAVSAIAHGLGHSCDIIKDYGGNDRVALIKGF